MSRKHGQRGEDLMRERTEPQKKGLGSACSWPCLTPDEGLFTIPHATPFCPVVFVHFVPGGRCLTRKFYEKNKDKTTKCANWWIYEMVRIACGSGQMASFLGFRS